MKQLGMIAEGENFISEGKTYKRGKLIGAEYARCQSLDDGKNYKLSVDTMVEDANENN